MKQMTPTAVERAMKQNTPCYSITSRNPAKTVRVDLLHQLRVVDLAGGICLSQAC